MPCREWNSRRGRHSLCASRRIFRPANDGIQFVSSHEILRREQWYLIKSAPWHALHALRSEYVTVLHMHKLESSAPLGPKYELPGGRASIVTAAKETSQQELYTQRYALALTAATTCSHQVLCDHARILIKRVGRLRATCQLIDRRQWRIKKALKKHTHVDAALQVGA